MRLSCLATIVLLLFAAPVAAQFVCDIDPWNQMADSGFGAGLGEIRGFGTTPPSFPPVCMRNGATFVDGVRVFATRQGGSTTMPIEGVEIRTSSMNGPPDPIVISTGPGGVISDVPVFPNHTCDPFLTDPVVVVVDGDNNGSLDNFFAPVVFIDGDATTDQFIPYSQTGSSVPCHTGLFGDPIDEPCFAGNPLGRAMGVGVRIAAGYAVLDLGGTDVRVRTNNPEVDPLGNLDVSFDGWTGDPLDEIRILDGPGGPAICSFANIPLETVESCLLNPAQALRWGQGKLFLEIIDDGFFDKEIIKQADNVFTDGFESGDTTRWDSTVP